MKYPHSIVKGLSMVLLTSAILISCKKTDKETETGYGGEQARLEQTFNDVENIADQAGTSGSLSTFRTEASILSGCATVTRDTISIPHVITVDFGSTNCLCNDGRYRRGQVIITYTGHYRDSGSVHTISFSNYFVNDNQVMGTKTVTNMGHNSSNQTYFNIAVSGSIVLASNNGILSWTANRVRTWVAGESTGVRIDDEYEITGSGTVTRPNNTTFTVNITSPLLIALNCSWINEGTIQVTPPNNVVRTLDYGNGTCDDQATLTINGSTTTITLP